MPRRTAQAGLGSIKPKKTAHRTSQLEEDYLGTIRCLGIQEPVREYGFIKDRRWRFDFAWIIGAPQYKNVAVEIDGGTWVKGAHSRGPRQTNDARKRNTATLNGWQVYVFTSDMVKSWEAARVTKEALGL